MTVPEVSAETTDCDTSDTSPDLSKQPTGTAGIQLETSLAVSGVWNSSGVDVCFPPLDIPALSGIEAHAILTGDAHPEFVGCLFLSNDVNSVRTW